jgi:hypothetical protein
MTNPCKTCRWHRVFSCPCQKPKCALRRLEVKDGKGCPQWKEKRSDPNG